MDTILNAHLLERAREIPSRLGSAVYEQSIFCLFHENAFQESVEAAKDADPALLGIRASAISFVPFIASFLLIEETLTRVGWPAVVSYTQHACYNVTFFQAVIMAPLLEEILFREIFQNAIGYLQGLGKSCISIEWQEGRIFTILLATETRIIIVSSVFAIVHLTNMPVLTVTTVAHVASMLLFPTTSLAFERGGLNASLSAHMTHNFICMIL